MYSEWKQDNYAVKWDNNVYSILEMDLKKVPKVYFIVVPDYALV